MKLVFTPIMITILLIKNTVAMNDQHIQPSNERGRRTRLSLELQNDKSNQQRTQKKFAQRNEPKQHAGNISISKDYFNLILSSGNQIQTDLDENFDKQNDFNSFHSFDNINFLFDNQSEIINHTIFNQPNIFEGPSNNEKSSEPTVREDLKVIESKSSFSSPIHEQNIVKSKEEATEFSNNKKVSYERIDSRNDLLFSEKQSYFAEKNNLPKIKKETTSPHSHLIKPLPEHNGIIVTGPRNKNKPSNDLDFDNSCLKDGSSNEDSSIDEDSSSDEEYDPKRTRKNVSLTFSRNKRDRKIVKKNELAERRNSLEPKNNDNGELFEIKNYDNPEGALEIGNVFSNRIVMERMFNFKKTKLWCKQLNLSLIKSSTERKAERGKKKKINSAKRNSSLFLTARTSLNLDKTVLEEVCKDNQYTYAIKAGALTFEFFLGIQKHSENAHTLRGIFPSKRNSPHLLKVCRNSSKIFLKKNYILIPLNNSNLKNKLVFERQVIAGFYHYLNTEIVIFIDLIVFGINNPELPKDRVAEKGEVSYLNKYSFTLKLRVGTKKCASKEVEEKMKKIYGKAEVEEIERNLKYYEVVEFDMNLF